MFLRYLIFIFLLSCAQPKEIKQSVSGLVDKPSLLPLWINYSKSVPDSLIDFFKVYMQSKQINVIGTKEAMEMIMSQANEAALAKIKSGNVSESEIKSVVEKTMKQPICTKIDVNLFKKDISSKLIIDSIKWDIIQMPPPDTTHRPKKYTYYPKQTDNRNNFLLWRDFADTILASGLAK